MFFKDVLISMEYRFQMKYFDQFIKSINEELPDGYELEEDGIIVGAIFFVHCGNVCIWLEKFTEDLFKLDLTIHPDE